MGNYSNTFNGSGKDAANSVIRGSEMDTQFNSIATMSTQKANKIAPGTVGNLPTLSSSGDLQDSGESIADIKAYADRGAIHLVADTDDIDFTNPATIGSTTTDLSVFLVGDVITVTGTTSNNNTFTVVTTSPTELTVSETVTTESTQTPTFTTEGVVQVLDEDTMGSDSATAVPSQQSVKAYVDTTEVPVAGSVVTCTGGSAIEIITDIPASATTVEVAFYDVEFASSSERPIIQLKNTDWVVTGYVNNAYEFDATPLWTPNIETTGVAVHAGSHGYPVYGILTLKEAGANKWTWTYIGGLAINDMHQTVGYIDLTDELTALRIYTSVPTGTWSTGSIRAWYY